MREGLRALLATQLCCPFVDFASAPCALEAMASERVRISMMRERRARSEARSQIVSVFPGKMRKIHNLAGSRAGTAERSPLLHKFLHNEFA